jgi:hypothetical protein
VESSAAARGTTVPRGRRGGWPGNGDGLWPPRMRSARRPPPRIAGSLFVGGGPAMAGRGERPRLCRGCGEQGSGSARSGASERWRCPQRCGSAPAAARAHRVRYRIGQQQDCRASDHIEHLMVRGGQHVEPGQGGGRLREWLAGSGDALAPGGPRPPTGPRACSDGSDLNWPAALLSRRAPTRPERLPGRGHGSPLGDGKLHPFGVPGRRRARAAAAAVPVAPTAQYPATR